MRYIFLGLTVANLLVLATTFALGLLTIDMAGTPTAMYPYHLVLAIFAGMLAMLVHMTTFTYFMATTKWLRVATDKKGLDPNRFVVPALAQKRRVFGLCMAAVITTMLAMFAGAGADPTVDPWWPGKVHFVLASVAVAANLICALGQYRFIRERGRTIDQVLAILNPPG